MKSIKVFLTMALSLVMMISTVACGRGNTTSSSSDKTSTDVSTDASTDSSDLSTDSASTDSESTGSESTDTTSPEESESTGSGNVGGDDIVDDELPKANVVVATADVLTAWNAEGVEFYYNKGVMATLETGYTFSATETVEEAKANEYAKWYADYYVSVDTAIEADQLGLAGSYQAWDNGKWLAFYAPALQANQTMGLLASVNIKWTYEEIVEYVVDFRCGAFDNEGACKGVTLKVELRLTNPADATDFVVINSTSYTFA